MTAISLMFFFGLWEKVSTHKDGVLTVLSVLFALTGIVVVWTTS